MTPTGFAHSEIHGSKGKCPSPWLIAAYHVLHRLPVPRHPPYALKIFIFLALLVIPSIIRDLYYLDEPLCSFQGAIKKSFRPFSLKVSTFKTEYCSLPKKPESDISKF